MVFGFAVVIIFLSGCTGADAKPNIILIVVDALRADHLGCYGYHRDTSPTIDSLAVNGVLWEDFQAQSSWTLPTVTSIFTGLNVREHGAGRRNGIVYGMSPELSTIPLLLNRAGYTCAGIFNVYLLSEQFGFNRGFDSFSCNWLGHGQAEVSVNQAIDWIQTTNTNQPFFLTLHLFDVHDPYDPPAPFDTYYTPFGAEGITWWPFLESGAPDHPEEYKEHLMGLYDGEIAWTDSQINRLFQHLRTSGLSENTVVILTADHGEEFLEHNGFGHGKTMYQEVVRVPLIISGSDIDSGVRYSSLRAQIDILPTILELSGVERPAHLNGISLLENISVNRSVPSSNVNSTFAPVVAAIRVGNRKIIWNTQTDEAVQFNLAEDPHELFPVDPEENLLDSVLFYWGTPPLFQPTTPDKNMIDSALRDLGYF